MADRKDKDKRKAKAKLKSLISKGKKGYKGITEAAIAVQVIAVALIIIVEIAGLMKDRELDLEAIGIKKDSKIARVLQQHRCRQMKKDAETAETRAKTATTEKR